MYPPGIIADINSFSARQRDSFQRAHGSPMVRDRAFNPMMRRSSASTPIAHRVFLWSELGAALDITLEHFREK
jgi:hypothetical protein